MARSAASSATTRREIYRTLLIAIFTLALLLDLHAGSLAGVTLPDSVNVGGTNLLLNGMGLRTKFMVKVYVVGLYLPQKSSDAGAIMNAEEPKRIVMQFLHSASKSQMADAFNESFANNSPDAAKAVKPDIDRLTAALEPVKPGDQMIFTYTPGKGITFALNGSDKLTIANPAFAPVLFSSWLGPKPPNADLKKGLLGQ